MGDILNEEEVGHFPQVSQSKYERMHEQYNSFLEEEHWQDVRDNKDSMLFPLNKRRP